MDEKYKSGVMREFVQNTPFHAITWNVIESDDTDYSDKLANSGFPDREGKLVLVQYFVHTSLASALQSFDSTYANASNWFREVELHFI